MKDLKDGLFKKKECTSCYNTIKEAAFKFRDFAPNQNTMDCVELCDCGNSKISESVDKQGEGTCHYCLGKLRKKDLPAYPESATIEEMGEFVKERQKLCDNKFNKIGDITFNNLPSTEYFHKLLYVLLMLQLRDPNIKPKKLLEILNKFNPINEEELGKFMTELGIKQKSIVSAPVIVPPMPEVPDTKLPDVTKPFPECTNKCKKWFISEDTDNSKITRKVENTSRSIQWKDAILAWTNNAGIQYNLLDEKLNDNMWRSVDIALLGPNKSKKLIGPFKNKTEAEGALMAFSLPVAPTNEPVSKKEEKTDDASIINPTTEEEREDEAEGEGEGEDANDGLRERIEERKNAGESEGEGKNSESPNDSVITPSAPPIDNPEENTNTNSGQNESDPSVDPADVADSALANRINRRREGKKMEKEEEEGEEAKKENKPEPPAKSPVRYSQPFVISRWQVYPGPYQPGLRVYASTGVDVPEWLKHLGQPNPTAQKGGKKRRKKNKSKKKRKKKKNTSRKK